MTTADRAAPPTILIVEDEPLILMEMSYAVEDEGAHPVAVTGAEQALAAISDERPDAAILDVTLGRGTTCEPVAARLRELGVPFLVHSGDLLRQGELIARIGAQVIPKPADSVHVAERAVALIASDCTVAE